MISRFRIPISRHKPSKKYKKGRHWRYSTRSPYADDVKYLVTDNGFIRFAAFKPGPYGNMEYYIQTKIKVTSSRIRRALDYPIYQLVRLSKYELPTDYTDTAGVFVSQGQRTRV